MSWWVIFVIAAGTFAFRISGPLLRRRISVSPRAVRLMSLAATALLVSLATTQTIYAGAGLAGWARVGGVGLAMLLIWRRAPFVIVVVGAATCTAGLRMLGIS